MFVGKRRPVNCLPPPICTSFPQWAFVWNMKGSEQNGKFPLHLPCSQSVHSDPDKECDIDDDSNKDIFSPQAFLLIRLICTENKWILTKCKRGCVLGGLDKRVWQEEGGWDSGGFCGLSDSTVGKWVTVTTEMRCRDFSYLLNMAFGQGNCSGSSGWYSLLMLWTVAASLHKPLDFRQTKMCTVRRTYLLLFQAAH